MTSRYIVWQGRTPRCDLPGSPFASKIAGKRAAKRAGFTANHVTAVRRATHAD